ncbi:pectin esterase [Flavobacterium sp. L1I52]|uniref:Pectinesterase n=1 Tax=Flavobacterium pokkalii TaxID=1940408 RepID=A0ABR7UQF7_9FLAO|nr:pectinesterase family protein [Flavobacterium pokkalii]MBD0725096.1 pectin esterase [Flavobacterium pokkalii]
MKKYFFGWLLSCLLLISTNTLFATNPRYTYIVALDGSGDYQSIQEAVTACGAFSMEEKIIFIKKGHYKEKILIDSFHSNITLVGESEKETIIDYNNYSGQQGIGTFTSYTLKILGDYIKIENLTVENSAGRVGQAVALHVEGDFFIASNCSILGNQDTLYTAGKNSRQYFKNCYISGTTDFIFGAATAIFEGCEIHSKTNSFITAANTPQENVFGYVFTKCHLTADDGVDKVYLGRPWRDYAKVVFMDCDLGKHILAVGWHNWDNPKKEKTAFFAEYNNNGEGANVSKRVSWSHQLTKSQAEKYQFKNIFQKESNWDLEKGDM